MKFANPVCSSRHPSRISVTNNEVFINDGFSTTNPHFMKGKWVELIVETRSQLPDMTQKSNIYQYITYRRIYPIAHTSQ